MNLKAFTVKDFRSINNSGAIEVEQRTALVGRNESGKSSLLRVLHGLKPGGGEMPAFTLARDYPRDRKRSTFNDAAIVLETTWNLTPHEQKALGRVWTRGQGAKTVEITRSYKAVRYVGFPDVPRLNAWTPILDGQRQALAITAAKALSGGDNAFLAAAFTAVEQAGAALQAKLTEESDPTTTATTLSTALAGLAAALKDTVFVSETTKLLSEMTKFAAMAAADHAQNAEARGWAVANLPSLVYLDDFVTVPGHYDIDQFVSRGSGTGQQATPEDKLFAKLLKVAELDATELKNLLTQNHEERKLLTDRASRQVTKTLRELWRDRQITVQFSVDAGHFDVVVSDADTNALVPLDERSRGFRWYFSFFITFAADTAGGDKANAVLLLDEPGLFLHATAQESLLQFFEKLPNQILYTTHSPFMINSRNLSTVRTVNLDEGTGTTVSNSPTGDANTLFPLQAALGYDLTQTLFVGTKNLVVEGVTDYWYLTSVAEHLRAQSRCPLDEDIVITPAGGAQKVSYMIALLTSQNLRVALLLDSEPNADRARDSLLSEKLIRDHGIVMVIEAFPTGTRTEADVEDLIDENVYMDLMYEVYKKDLAGRPLQLNASIPRIVKRLEHAFDALGLKFNKTRIARRFLNRMPTDSATLLANGAEARFETLLTLVKQAVDKVSKADKPFG